MIKLAIIFSMTIAAAAGAMAMPASANWGRSIGAQPEALLIGASLLVLASILRHRCPEQITK